MKKLFIGITALFFITISYAQQNVGPEVRTKSGVVRGETEEGVSYFKGIPYATPPVGANRWRPPQPVTPCKDVRDTTKDCADCPQRAGPGYAIRSV